MIPGNANPLLLASAADGAAAAADITKSLRFNSGDSAYLSRTPSSVGNRRTWTYSCWVKRTNISGVYPRMFGTYTGGSYIGWDIEFNNNDKIDVHYYDGSSYVFRRTTTAVYRDPSAWYHIVVAADTTASTADDRLKLYVNGVEVDTFDAKTNVSQNYDTNINTAIAHRIGLNYSYSDFYLADVYFIDGSQLEPTSFGAFDDSGVWQAAAYSGTFGTNGFHLLDFANESTVGHDSSGNNNDFTANNLTATVTDASRLPGSPSYRESTSTNQTWDDSSSASSTSSAIGPDRLYWVDLGSSQTFNKVTFSVVASGQSSNTNGNFIVYFSTDSDSLGTNMCNNCTVAVDAVTSGSTPGTITVEFSGFATQTGRYIGITNGNSAPGGTYTYSSFDVSLAGNPADLDVLFDVPTNGDQSDTGAGGEVSGNYAIWNALGPGGSSTYGTLSNGNLRASLPASGKALAQTIFPQSGKWYCEIDFVSGGGAGGGLRIGVINEKNIAIDLGSTANSWAYLADGRVYHNASAASYGVSSSPGDKLMMALDIDAGKLWYGKNGTWMASGDPANGSNPSQTFTAGQKMSFSAQSGSGTVQVVDANWGQRAWSYTAPSGFKAVCTTNLPTPTIADSSDYFETVTWTGTGASKSLTTGFSPDFIWLKNRAISSNHRIFDTVRGQGVMLHTNTTNNDQSDTNNLTSFDSSGFTVGTNSNTNGSGNGIVAWTWDAGSSTVSNTDGSITSSVRANQTAGFSIVTYSVPSSGTTFSVGHGLGAAPSLIIAKDRDSANPWGIYHSALGVGKGLLFSTATEQVNSNWWNNTNPTSTLFYLNTGIYAHSQPGNDYVAYCFAPVAGYSQISSWEGNGSTDGPFVHTGFRPAFILYKASDAAEHWHIRDAVRDPFNVTSKRLTPSTANAEDSGSDFYIDLLSNGFKLRASSATQNQSGTTYVYYAAAENPFQANGGLAR